MKNKLEYLALAVLLAFLAIWLTLPFIGVGQAVLGSPNVSVITRVNISNSPPAVMNVTVTTPITLVANSTSLVWCNVSVKDFNNITDLGILNATLFSYNYSANHFANFNQTHYSNESCTNFTDDSTFTRTYNCGFHVNYNAVPSNWTCNATIVDNSSIAGHGFGTSRVNHLLAIGVADEIDFGTLPSLNVSFNVPFNITNYGNTPINLSVFGYGRTENDNISMHCSQGNLSISDLRVSSNSSNISYPVNFDMMMPLNGSNLTRRMIPHLTLFSYNMSAENATNTTIWRLFISDTNKPGGLCNGTVVFTAELANT